MKYGVNDVYFDTHDAALDVLHKLQDLSKNYGNVYIADFYELVNKSIECADYRYGWTNLDNCTVTRYHHGYKIGFPEISELKKMKLNNSKPPRTDMVAHPPHYQSENGIEVIDVIEAFTTDLAGIEATDTGNIIKYICRWSHKNGVEDLEKAKWYLEHLIKHVKAHSKGEQSQ